MELIVVGFGAHESGAHALEWAAVLAQRAEARLLVVSVLHPSHADPSDEKNVGPVEERRRTVRELAQRRALSDVEFVIRSGEAVEELLRFTNETRPDVVVVGHRDSMAPWGLGERGAAEILLRESATPFVVVGEGAPLPRSAGALVVIVGVDGSPSNVKAMAAVSRIVEDLGARPEPVYVTDTGASSSRGAHGAVLQHQREAEAVASRLPGQPPLLLLNEEPVNGLLLAAREAGADLIAVGTPGHRRLMGLFAGQLVRHLIDDADRAVLVAPHS